MEWSNETILEFLDYYEKEPVIWNPAFQTNKNRNDAYEAWKRIQINLNNQFSISELKKKKDSLMASYRGCRSRIKKSQKNGARRDEIYQPKWFAYEKMLGFLKGKDDPLNIMDSKDFQSHEDYDIIESDIIDISQEKVIPSTSTSKNLSFQPSTQKRKLEELNDDSSNSSMSVDKRVKGKDVYDVYGELIAIKLRQLSENSREIAMNRIDNFLFEMKMDSSSNSYPSLSLQTPSYPDLVYASSLNTSLDSKDPLR